MGPFPPRGGPDGPHVGGETPRGGRGEEKGQEEEEEEEGARRRRRACYESLCWRGNPSPKGNN